MGVSWKNAKAGLKKRIGERIAKQYTRLCKSEQLCDEDRDIQRFWKMTLGESGEYKKLLQFYKECHVFFQRSTVREHQEPIEIKDISPSLGLGALPEPKEEELRVQAEAKAGKPKVNLEFDNVRDAYPEPMPEPEEKNQKRSREHSIEETLEDKTMVI